MGQNYLDLEEGLSRVRGNKVLFKKMLQMFTASTEFEKFDDCISAGDISGAADVAHAIKGMTGNLSLTALFEISTTLMNELREGTLDNNSISEYREILAGTLVEVNRVCDEI